MTLKSQCFQIDVFINIVFIFGQMTILGSGARGKGLKKVRTGKLELAKLNKGKNVFILFKLILLQQ